MDALLFCGGEGTRLDAGVEKPLLPVGGRPMVDRVADALAASRVGTTYAVVSPNAPATREHVADRLPLVETAGEGYVADLVAALDDDRVAPPVLTVAADLPLLDGRAVDAALDAHDRVVANEDLRGTETWGETPGLTVAVPAAAKRDLGLSVDDAGGDADDGRVPAGINVVTGAERDVMHVTDDARYAVNVNRLRDAQVADALAGGTDGTV